VPNKITPKVNTKLISHLTKQIKRISEIILQHYWQKRLWRNFHLEFHLVLLHLSALLNSNWPQPLDWFPDVTQKDICTALAANTKITHTHTHIHNRRGVPLKLAFQLPRKTFARSSLLSLRWLFLYNNSYFKRTEERERELK